MSVWVYRRPPFAGVRLLGWQLDYRADRWTRVHLLREDWGHLTLGRLGCVSWGRVIGWRDRVELPG